ncbi:7798_t:CDS:2, partial [Acaulospora colombiana]
TYSMLFDLEPDVDVVVEEERGVVAVPRPELVEPEGLGQVNSGKSKEWEDQNAKDGSGMSMKYAQIGMPVVWGPLAMQFPPDEPLAGPLWRSPLDATSPFCPSYNNTKSVPVSTFTVHSTVVFVVMDAGISRLNAVPPGTNPRTAFGELTLM